MFQLYMTIINNTGFSSLKVFCESSSADVNISNSRKVWSLQNPVIIPANSSVKMLCSVESCSIPLSYYTINETNNAFRVNVNGGSYTTHYITQGNYTAKSIIDEMTGSASVPFKMEFNTALSTYKMAPKVAGQSINFEAVSNSVYKMLGIEVGAVGLPFSTTYYSPNPVSLVYTSGIYIAINNIGNANIDTSTSNQSSNCLIRIPITQPSNTILQFFNNVGFKNLLSSKILNQIDLSLLDDNRNPLELTSNVNWSVVLRIDFERSVVETFEKTRLQHMKDGTLSESV